MNLKRTIAGALCLALTICLVPGAGAAEEADTVEVGLSNIYELSYKNNVNARIADTSLLEFHLGLNKVQDALSAAWTMLEVPGYETRASQMLDSLVGLQATRETEQKTELSVENAKKQVALGGQSMLVAFYSLENQRAGLEASQQKLSRGLQAMKAMQTLGLATNDAVTGLERSQRQLEASGQALSNARRTLFEQLALYVGVKADQMDILPFEGPTHERAEELLAAIDYEADLNLAQERCLKIKIQKLTAEDNASASKAVERLRLDALRAEFPSAFQRTTLDLKDKAAQLGVAEDTYAANVRAAEIAGLKLSLGTISKNAYGDALSEAALSETALISAQLDFTSALQTYAAMVDGMWLD